MTSKQGAARSTRPRRTTVDDLRRLVQDSTQGTEYEVRLDTEVDNLGRKTRLVVGSCPNGHRIRIRLSLWHHGQRCATCDRRPIGTKRAERHLAAARAEGLKVELLLRRDHGRSHTWLVGECALGHPLELRVAAFAQGQRCGSCRLQGPSMRHLATLLDRGFKGSISLEPVSQDRCAAFFVGTCPVGHELHSRVANLMRAGDSGCRTCAIEALGAESRALVLEMAQSEGYAVDVVLRRNPASAQNQARLVGTCPAGHRVDMWASNFSRGARCASCAKNGFKVGLAAVFYVLTGRYQGRPVLKFGVSNDFPRRLLTHRSNGLEVEPFLVLGFSLGREALDLETDLKAALRRAGVPTCRARGHGFLGSTESHFLADLSLDEVLVLLCEWFAEGLVDRVGGQGGPGGDRRLSVGPGLRRGTGSPGFPACDDGRGGGAAA